ncbi:MAG TPA: histidine kinase dimerization/phospho-acceptor domain-containing protein, partial [Arachidicoccus sp.]|nr:histidine kinase dimerization/phospho-acceptor domain-containing protein [Arachidicoccus sp.]
SQLYAGCSIIGEVFRMPLVALFRLNPRLNDIANSQKPVESQSTIISNLRLIVQTNSSPDLQFNPESFRIAPVKIEDKLVIFDDLLYFTGNELSNFGEGNEHLRFLAVLPLAVGKEVEQSPMPIDNSGSISTAQNEKDDDAEMNMLRSHPLSCGNSLLLCLMDEKPRMLDDIQKVLLSKMARQLLFCWELQATHIEKINQYKKLRHDLRTPLTSITMLSQLVGSMEGMDSEMQEMCELMLKAAQKMDALIAGAADPV